MKTITVTPTRNQGNEGSTCFANLIVFYGDIYVLTQNISRPR